MVREVHWKFEETLGRLWRQHRRRMNQGPEVAGLLFSEVARLSTLPPGESELTPRKAALIGEFSRNLETVWRPGQPHLVTGRYTD